MHTLHLCPQALHSSGHALLLYALLLLLYALLLLLYALLLLLYALLLYALLLYAQRLRQSTTYTRPVAWKGAQTSDTSRMLQSYRGRASAGTAAVPEWLQQLCQGCAQGPRPAKPSHQIEHSHARTRGDHCRHP